MRCVQIVLSSQADSRYSANRVNCRYCAEFCPGEVLMAAEKQVKRPQSRGERAKTQSVAPLAEVIDETLRLWRKHHLGYDQTKYVVERVRRRLALEPPRPRNLTGEQLGPGGREIPVS